MRMSALAKSTWIAYVSAFFLIALAMIAPSLSVLAQDASVFKPTADTPVIDSAVPTGQDELFDYLTSGAYTEFVAQESSAHPSRGPHTKPGWPVRVFLDPIVDASLAAGNESHPIGSSLVKEMFDGDGELQGWAVMVKTSDDSNNGKGWFWYEVTSTTSGADPVAIGNGVQLCQGCHFIGKDFVLTTYPLQ